jgi:hypothetical protein
LAQSKGRGARPAANVSRETGAAGLLIAGGINRGIAGKVRPALPRENGRSIGGELEHLQEKWNPVFRPKMRQTRES